MWIETMYKNIFENINTFWIMIVSYVDITGYYIIMVTTKDIIILLLSYMVTAIVIIIPYSAAFVFQVPAPITRTINQTIVTYPMLTVC